MQRSTSHPEAVTQAARLGSAVGGAVLGLVLIKFGNPVIMYAQAPEMFPLPRDLLEWLILAWPYALGVFLTAIAAAWIAAVLVGAPKQFNRLMLLPVAWLVWQCAAAVTGLDPGGSAWVVSHFACCVAWFYVGALVFGRVHPEATPWTGLVLGTVCVIAAGVEQRFGGLEETRRYFWQYVYPGLATAPPELIKRMQSDRIFSTLFYPNTLAGALILCTPVVLWAVWSMRRWFERSARVFLVLVVLAGALGCLVWSGSKAGWLIALGQVMVLLLRVRMPARLRSGILTVVCVTGLVVFAWRYAGYFQRGATSLGARLDYWTAAVKITGRHPIAGIGQGNFGRVYAQIKPPDAEMTRMVHNDYLQQACESGLVGLALYALMLGSVLLRARPDTGGHWPPRFWIWLGLVGWSVHSMFEFGLYIPALAWPAFCMLGVLVRDSDASTGSELTGAQAVGSGSSRKT